MQIFDYYSLIDLDPQLDPFLEGKDSQIIQLEIHHYYLSPEQENKNKTHKWVDLDGARNLWLKLINNTQQAQEFPITHIEFLYFQQEDNYLKIPLDYTPVYIQNDPNIKYKIQKPEKSVNGVGYYNGNYDLTQLLNQKANQGYSLCLCYRSQGVVKIERHISDVQVVIAEKREKSSSNKTEYKISINKNYFVIQLSFGWPEQNRLLIFKLSQDLFKTPFKSHILDECPSKLEYKNLGMFIFPNGIFLQKNVTCPISYNLILTQENAERKYVTCLIFQEPYTDLNYMTQEVIYKSKAICLVSNFPFLEEAKEILKQLYRISLSKQIEPIEHKVSSILDLQIPEQNHAMLFNFGNSQIIFQNCINYPYLNKISLENLFRTFNSDQIIFLIQAVLLERKIVLISKNKQLLTQIATSLITLIFPFTYQQILIPILPDNLKDYIDAPVPFIIGVKNYESSQANMDIIQVKIDTGEYQFIGSLPPLPQKAFEQLKQKLQIYDVEKKSIDIIENAENAFFTFQDSFSDLFDPFYVRDAFLEFFSSFMKNYKKFILQLNKKNISQEKDFNEIFDVNGFLDSNNQTKQGSFLQKFTETITFTQFIQNKLFNQDSKVQYYTSFFDISLLKKRTKKEPQILHATPNIIIENVLQKPKSNKVFYEYKNYPILEKEKLNIKQRQTIDTTNYSIMQSEILLDQLDEKEWCNYILENCNLIFFLVLKIQIRQNYIFQENLSDYAMIIIKELRNKIKISQAIYREAIEIQALQYKQEALFCLTDNMNQEKIDNCFVQSIFLKYFGKNKKSKISIQNFNIGTTSPVTFYFDDKSACPNCGRIAYLEEIFSGFSKSFNEFQTICQVNSCKNKYAPIIQLLLQEKIMKKISFQLYSPLFMVQKIETFSEKNENLFQGNSEEKTLQYNILFYLSLLKFPTFLGYDISESNVESYVNHEISKVEERMQKKRRSTIMNIFNKNNESSSQETFSLFGGYSELKPDNKNMQYVDKYQNLGNSSFKKIFGGYFKDMIQDGIKMLNDNLSTEQNSQDIGPNIQMHQFVSNKSRLI